MKVSFSPFSAATFSESLPGWRLPSWRESLWGIGLLLASLLLGTSLWVLSAHGYLSALGSKAAPATAPIAMSEAEIAATYESAIALRQSGDLLGALHQLEQLVLAAPQSVPVRYELGRAQFQLGFIQAAIAQYRTALAINPDHAPSAYELGSILVTLGQVEEGIQHLQHSAALAPTALTFYDLGIALGRVEDTAAKVDALKQAIALQPDYADAHLNLGLTYARQNDLEAAKRSLKTARDLYQAEIEQLEHAHLGRNSLDAQIIDQMLAKLETGCGVECWAAN